MYNPKGIASREYYILLFACAFTEIAAITNRPCKVNQFLVEATLNCAIYEEGQVNIKKRPTVTAAFWMWAVGDSIVTVDTIDHHAPVGKHHIAEKFFEKD